MNSLSTPASHLNTAPANEHCPRTKNGALKRYYATVYALRKKKGVALPTDRVPRKIPATSEDHAVPFFGYIYAGSVDGGFGAGPLLGTLLLFWLLMSWLPTKPAYDSVWFDRSDTSLTVQEETSLIYLIKLFWPRAARMCKSTTSYPGYLDLVPLPPAKA